MGVTISGTFSGLDASAIISTLIAADSVPMTNLETTDTSLDIDLTQLATTSVAGQTFASSTAGTTGSTGSSSYPT